MCLGIPGRIVEMHPEVPKNLAPEESRVAIHHGNPEQTCVDHFHQIVVGQILRRSLEPDRRLALRHETAIQGLKMGPVARRPTDYDLLAGEVVDRIEHGGLRPGDRDLADPAKERSPEVCLCQSLRSEGENADGHVSSAVE